MIQHSDYYSPSDSRKGGRCIVYPTSIQYKTLYLDILGKHDVKSKSINKKEGPYLDSSREVTCKKIQRDVEKGAACDEQD